MNPSSLTWPTAKGFDQFFGYNDQANAHNYYPYWMWQNQASILDVCISNGIPHYT